MAWTPKIGTETLSVRVGRKPALRLLVSLLSARVEGSDLLRPPWHAALLDIGGRHASRLLHDPTGSRLAYWPRAWAARSMAYLGDLKATPSLLNALSDEHWRVRMNAIQTLGRIGAFGVTDQVVNALADEHERVRQAAVVALGRVGDDFAIGNLVSFLAQRGASASGRVERAITEIGRRS